MAEGLAVVDFHQSNCKKQKEIGLSTFTVEAKGRCSLQNAYVALLFDQDDGLLKEVWVGHE